MEKENPTETTPEVVTEPEAPTPEVTPEPAAEPVPEETPDSSSQEENAEDLTALIAEEKKHGKPDPQKARERFEKKRQREEPEEDEYIDEDEKPVTRRELQEMLAEQAHRNALESQQDAIAEISESLAESPSEAELIRTIHANRVFPAGMSLREQMMEAQAIATVKRTQAKNAELARTIKSQQTVSRNTATTHRDPQAALEPDLAPDLKASMQRAGYTYNNTARRYEKVLPNGKILVKEPNRPPYLAN